MTGPKPGLHFNNMTKGCGLRKIEIGKNEIFAGAGHRREPDGIPAAPIFGIADGPDGRMRRFELPSRGRRTVPAAVIAKNQLKRAGHFPAQKSMDGQRVSGQGFFAVVERKDEMEHSAPILFKLLLVR